MGFNKDPDGSTQSILKLDRFEEAAEVPCPERAMQSGKGAATGHNTGPLLQ